MKRFGLLAAAVAAVVAVLVVFVASSGGSGTKNTRAAGGGTQSTAGTPYGGATTAPAPTANSVIAVRNTPLGKVLVDGKGRTLYLFEADKPNVSKLSTAGLAVWPTVSPAGKAQAGSGAIATKVGTITGVNGKPQAAYDGHPLYYYVGDQHPGDTHGQGLNQFGAAWYVVSATGQKIDNG